MTSPTQLWATLADLYDVGPPRGALASVSARRRERTLRAASGTIASYIRGPYKLPLRVDLDEVYSLSLGGSVQCDSLGALTEAAAYGVRITTGGQVGVDPIVIAWGSDFNPEAAPADWPLQETGVALPASGILETPSGIRFLFTGVLSTGGAAWVRAGVADEVMRAVVHVASYDLLFTRGIEPGTEDANRLEERRKEAIEWAKEIQKRDAKLDEGSDATPGAIEPRPRFGSRGTSNPWLGPDPYGSRCGSRHRRGCGC